MMDKDQKWEIVKQVGVFGEKADGSTQQLNLIKWYGNAPKYDLRNWLANGNPSKNGFTIAREDLERLQQLIESIPKE